MIFEFKLFWMLALLLGTIELIYIKLKSTHVLNERSFREIGVSIFYSFITHNIRFSFLGLFLELLYFSYNNRFFNLFRGGVLYWISLLILAEFTLYITHRIMHSSRLAWIHHGVHHSFEEINLLNGMRSINMEPWLILYSILCFIGFQTHDVISIFVIQMYYQTLLHWRRFPSLGIFEKIFITPRNHILHHGVFSDNKIYNFGGITLLCDFIFNTYTDKSEKLLYYGISDIKVKKPNIWSPFLKTTKFLVTDIRKLTKNIF